MELEGWNTFHQEVPAGVLPVVVLIEHGAVSQVRMTQAEPMYFEELDDLHFLQSLGLSSSDADVTQPAQFVSTAMKQLILPLRTRNSLSRIQIRGTELEQALAKHESHLVYAFAEENGVFYARGFFTAGSFVVEDPATGSAAGALGAYLWKHRNIATPLEILQGQDMGRGATIRVQVSDGGRVVKVGGSAVIVAHGELKV